MRLIDMMILGKLQYCEYFTLKYITSQEMLDVFFSSKKAAVIPALQDYPGLPDWNSNLGDGIPQE